jgi:hypothetical protein
MSRIKPKILLLSYDEKNKKYNHAAVEKNIKKVESIIDAKKDHNLIICFTQDSVGCYGEEHFQHYLKDLLII